MIIDLTTRNYPETVRDLRVAFPNSIIPDNPSDADLSALGRARVQSTPVPEYDSITQIVRELDPEETVDGFVQRWEVYALSEEEAAANRRSLIPQEVTRYKALAALAQAGLYEAVETWVARPETPLMVKIAWSTAQEFRRDSQFIADAAAAMGMTDEQVDQLFAAADAFTDY